MEEDHENSKEHKAFLKAFKEFQKFPKLSYGSRIGCLLRRLGIVSEKKIINGAIKKLDDLLCNLEGEIRKYEDLKEDITEYRTKAEELIEKYDGIVNDLGYEAEQLKNRYREIKKVQITNTYVPVLKEECYRIRKEFRGVRMDLRALESKMEKTTSLIDYNSNVKGPLIGYLLDSLKNKYDEAGRLKESYEILNTTQKAS